jgi:hypothetical protein
VVNGAVKEAATEFLRAQAEFAAAGAPEAGVAVNPLWTSRLQESPERDGA